jgi:hypothetical protein
VWSTQLSPSSTTASLASLVVWNHWKMKLRGPQWVNQGLTSSKTPRFDLSSYLIFPPPHRGCGRFVVAKFSSLVTSFCCCLPVKNQCGHSTHLRGPSWSKSFVSGWNPIESSCYQSIYFFWGASCISLSWILFAFPSNMWTLIQEMWKQDHKTGTLAKPLFLGVNCKQQIDKSTTLGQP